MLWHPTNSEAEDWFELKAKESEGLRLSPDNWLQQYLYLDVHEKNFTESLLYYKSGCRI